MNETEIIQLAEKVATAAHRGQKRRNGEPYIIHPTRVANKVNDRLKPIAWLHDVLEDTSVTLDDLRQLGFPAYVINAVVLLTHKKEDTNMVYWNKILMNPDAVTVKMTDIEDNLNDTPSEHAKEKYAKALALFKKYGYSV